ncbi:MAG: hypothetical protein ABII74_02420 [Elusimicrobiota bacterium]
MKDDWQLNTTVRAILVRNWLVSEKLKILSIHGAVLIQGDLEFSGTLRGEDDIFVIGRKLKKVERRKNNGVRSCNDTSPKNKKNYTMTRMIKRIKKSVRNSENLSN